MDLSCHENNNQERVGIKKTVIGGDGCAWKKKSRRGASGFEQSDCSRFEWEYDSYFAERSAFTMYKVFRSMVEPSRYF